MITEVLLRYHRTPQIERIEVYQRNGGYQALSKAAKMPGTALIDLVEAAGLRGRGGAGYPTARKRGLVSEQEKIPHYFICKIAGGETRAFKDRDLLKNPHQVLEATAIAAHAVGAKQAFVYLRGSFQKEERLLKQALVQARSKQLLGADRGLPVNLIIHRGEDAYIAGEETA